MKKFTTISVLISYFFLLFIPTSFAQNFLFPDVKGSDWFYEDVLNMIKWGVMKGNSDGTFRPQNSVNRAEVSVILNRYDAKMK
ncbi:S-layer homology domain-containing protein [Candidatus Peregrinibacteria bacterium]|nr:S-layer homology domain-containing protein [Candidatus Peregrinibacteria bacterium]